MNSIRRFPPISTVTPAGMIIVPPPSASRVTLPEVVTDVSKTKTSPFPKKIFLPKVMFDSVDRPQALL